MFRNLVVPLDTSPLSEQAAWKAAAIARAAQGTLHVVHVFEPRLPAFDGGAVIDERILALERAQLERHFRNFAERLTKRFGCKCLVATLDGTPAESIAAYASQHGADLLVMSTHGRTGMSRAWFGSVADTVARESSLPVLLVRRDERAASWEHVAPVAAFERILIALDGSETAEAILECVRSLPSAASAVHLLVDVVRPVSMPILDYPDIGVMLAAAPDVEATAEIAAQAGKYLEDVADRFGRDGAAAVETKVVMAPSAGPAIVDLAHQWHADLVAMTGHGRGASRLLVGSVADKILRGTHCSILFRRAAVAKAAAPRRNAHKARALLENRVLASRSDS